MKVWVVGGAGYIGSHVCKALIKAGHEPVVFDNLSTGLRSNVLPGIPFREGDILDLPVLRAAAREFRFDGVVHLAALKAAGESMEVPERYSRANIVGSLNLLESVLEAGIPNFVFSSTAAVYGEPQYLPLDEKHSTKPENYYGHTKLAIEGFIEWYGRLKGLKHVCLRYFNAAGYDPDGELQGLEQNPANLLPVVMETAMGWRKKLQIFGDDYPTRDGTCIRDYIHVSDLADAHVKALDYLHTKGGNLTVNLGTGSGITVMEMVRLAMQVTGRGIPFEIVARRVGDAVSVLASSDKALETLGWKARYSDGETLLKTTWKAYQANASSRKQPG
ncbi:MAG TPA: UDP-glucose 4-epimerase GalE [Fibrobacteres bacterium]|nr:UDP-glucose 4-epimerase GalE [Fibrobacterota bacterium]